jgi:hypothetical protein
LREKPLIILNISGANADKISDLIDQSINKVTCSCLIKRYYSLVIGPKYFNSLCTDTLSALNVTLLNVFGNDSTGKWTGVCFIKGLVQIALNKNVFIDVIHFPEDYCLHLMFTGSK